MFALQLGHLALAVSALRGVLHMNMTVFVGNGTTPVVVFFGQHTNLDLTKFATRLVDDYLNAGWNMSQFPSPNMG